MFLRVLFKLRCLILENWQRGWILSTWVMAMATLFAWKFLQYKNRAAFQVMGYCLCTDIGAAETLKLNMALIILPVCRITLTWLRSTKARSFVPFVENIIFHKTIACRIAIRVLVHAGSHLSCDFIRLTKASPERFALIASDFSHGERPTYSELLIGVVGVTGVSMVILMAITFILATSYFGKTVLRFPAPFNGLTGFNALWYSHHLLGVVYILLVILVGLGIGATPFISILRDLLNNSRAEDQMDLTTETTRSDDSRNSLASSSFTANSSSSDGGKKRPQRTRNVTREPGSFEWFKGVMDEVAEMDHKDQIELHNYLTSAYEEGDVRSTLITLVQALNHAKHGKY
ncbi:hypothetical protein GOBAR_AA20450 [Gossypium barbadense]|uniref:Ferric reductase NAD binding domain-containing protein n=1 Tax=Gossypium barbadense TaxID=3634 RepID=A0A2P5XA61_GOSBA|nr:hypothetical protein GOBAR_AA20450 [Gossypium barbadense]